MTGVRSWVRRGLAHQLEAINLNLDLTNPDRMALQAGEICLNNLWKSGIEGFPSWRIATGEYQDGATVCIPDLAWRQPSDDAQAGELDQHLTKLDAKTYPPLVFRHMLQKWSPDDPHVSISKKLAVAMEATLDTLGGFKKGSGIETKPFGGILSWDHLVIKRPGKSSTSTEPSQEFTTLRLSCSRIQNSNRWAAPSNLHSILSLWIHSLTDRVSDHPGMQMSTEFFRILGLGTSFEPHVLEKLLDWIRQPIYICPYVDGASGFQDPTREQPSRFPVFGLVSPATQK